MTDAYVQALADLRRVGPFDGDADAAYIVRVAGDLGFTDAHVVAYVHGADIFVREVPDPDSWDEAEWDERRRYLLGVIQSWIAPVDIPAYDFVVPDEDDEPDYPGLRVPDALWWHLSLGFAGRNADKIDPTATDWYALDRETGWLAYAAGFDVAEWRNLDQKPDLITLRTMLALRAQSATDANVGSAAAARRVQAALAAFDRCRSRLVP